MKNEQTFEAGLCVKDTCIKTKGTGEKGSKYALIFSILILVGIGVICYFRSNSTNS